MKHIVNTAFCINLIIIFGNGQKISQNITNHPEKMIIKSGEKVDSFALATSQLEDLHVVLKPEINIGDKIDEQIASNASVRIQKIETIASAWDARCPKDEDIKTEYLEAKSKYEKIDEISRAQYSTLANCLQPVLQRNEITEEELGIAPSVEEFPYKPDEGAEPGSVSLNIVANSGRVKIPNTAETFYYGNWLFTGLYEPPGKIVTVVTPRRFLGKVCVLIGPHTDQIYRLMGSQKLRRDPDISIMFEITEEIQAVGSPYGGLIVIQFTDATMAGESLNMRFDNVLEAPHFILGKHNNTDWNNQQKHLPAPWAVFEIPKLITFVVPKREVVNLAHVTSGLEVWKHYMLKNDFAAGIIDRPVGELVVFDIQSAYGSAHSQYPVVCQLGVKVFPPSDGLFTVTHEVGHNMAGRRSGWYISHTSVNLFYIYGQDQETRETGIWGRESRMFDFIMSRGERRDTDTWWFFDILRIPMDGLDGSGWEHDGTWDDFPLVLAEYNKISKDERSKLDKDREDQLSFWVKQVCKAKRMNMIPYFQFCDFPILPSATEECTKYSKKPTEIMSWVSELTSLAGESTGCQELGGYHGHVQKCFIISRDSFTYEKAKRYCEDLNGQLAHIETKKDAILVECAYFQYKYDRPSIKRIWIENVSDANAFYPFGKQYEVEQNEHIVLDVSPWSSTETKCHYGLKKHCLIPFKPTKQTQKVKALCEISI